jgi:hypothetical protein
MSVKSNSDEEGVQLKPNQMKPNQIKPWLKQIWLDPIRQKLIRLKQIWLDPIGQKLIRLKPKKHNYRKIIRHWISSVLLKRGVIYSLIVTLVIFALYVIGGIPDPGISDRLLFLLLRLLSYSSVLLCAFSLFAMGLKIRRLVYNPSLHNIVGLFLYFLCGLFGAALVIFNSFIIAASSGNL